MTREREEEARAEALRLEAAKIAEELIAHAKETARQMLLGTNLDTSKIPLICNKIIKIQVDLAWLKWLVMGSTTGVFGLFVLVLGLVINKVL